MAAEDVAPRGAAPRGADGAAAARGKAKTPVLPWMRVPLTFDPSDGTLLENMGELDPRLARALRAQGVEALFPVQTALWAATRGGRSTAHDMCISAPTGSGKTLAYSLPALSDLAREGPGAARGPRMLVVLPTRDLARQVADVLRPLAGAVGLRVALLGGGGASPAGEAVEALGRWAAEAAAGKGARVAAAARGAVGGVAPELVADAVDAADAAETAAASDASINAHLAADVVVATPGRLVRHLSSTPSFSLAAVRWLVADETDRLLRQAYHGWLPKTLKALEQRGAEDGRALTAVAAEMTALQATRLGDLATLHQADAAGWSLDDGAVSRTFPAALGSRDASSAFSAASSELSTSLLDAFASGAPCRRVVKMVASATLTRNPGKLARLELEAPRFVTLANEEKRYALPGSLREEYSLVDEERKPHALVALLASIRAEAQGAGNGGATLGEKRGSSSSARGSRSMASSRSAAKPSRTIVFASSVETTRRLTALLLAVGASQVGPAAEYSSAARPEARAAALRGFADGAVSVLVASDAMTRGIDVPDVDWVVNYDPPIFPKTYVHRAGRTARAGKAGAVHSLLRREDLPQFRAMARKIDGANAHSKELPLESTQAAVETALTQLSRTVHAIQAKAIRGTRGHGSGKKPRLEGVPLLVL